LVSGKRKRDILARVLEGPIDPEVPASFLREANDVTLLVDGAAWGER
jgi:6-phosphogluconolactonase/glucosamine-6-phosphate isomerase/deaminase